MDTLLEEKIIELLEDVHILNTFDYLRDLERLIEDNAEGKEFIDLLKEAGLSDEDMCEVNELLEERDEDMERDRIFVDLERIFVTDSVGTTIIGSITSALSNTEIRELIEDRGDEDTSDLLEYRTGEAVIRGRLIEELRERFGDFPRSILIGLTNYDIDLRLRRTNEGSIQDFVNASNPPGQHDAELRTLLDRISGGGTHMVTEAKVLVTSEAIEEL